MEQQFVWVIELGHEHTTACLHSVICSQFTVSKYHTVSIGLQESSKPAMAELFKALNGSIGFWKYGKQQLHRVGMACGGGVAGPSVISFHGAQDPWRHPCVRETL